MIKEQGTNCLTKKVLSARVARTKRARSNSGANIADGLQLEVVVGILQLGSGEAVQNVNNPFALLGYNGEPVRIL
jgi:hypothetical protein